MYGKFRNVPIFEDFSPMCPYFLGFRVGKHVISIFFVLFLCLQITALAEYLQEPLQTVAAS